MRKLMMAVCAATGLSLAANADGSLADCAVWFDECVETVEMAKTNGTGRTAFGTWSNLSGQVEIESAKVVVGADDETPVAYSPDVVLQGDDASVEMKDVVFGAARTDLPELAEGTQAAVTLTTNEDGKCVFAVVADGAWRVTTKEADPVSNYTVRVDFAYGDANKVSYYLVEGASATVILENAGNPVAEKVSALELAGNGSFAALSGTYLTSSQVPIYTVAELMQALADLWKDIGAEEIAVHEPSAAGEVDGVVRSTVEVKAAEGSFLRGFCDFKRDDAFVDTTPYVPSNALLAMSFDSNLLWTENTANRLRAHLPDLANLLDDLRGVADDVCGGMYACVVPDDEASLTGMGATFGIGVRNGEETWKLLTDVLAKAGEVVPGTEGTEPGTTKSVSLRSNGLVGRLLGGGREPQLVLVSVGNGSSLICGYSSGSIRQRCEEAVLNGRCLYANPEFLDKANPILDDRTGDRELRGFAYVAPGFVEAFAEATKGLLNLPLELLGFLDAWAFSIVETTADKVFVTTRMSQETSEAVEPLVRLGVMLVGEVIPAVHETVKFDKEKYEPSEDAKERLDSLLTLLKFVREAMGVRGFDYRYRPETEADRTEAGIPEPEKDFMTTVLSVKTDSESSRLLNLVAAGTAADASAAERYLPDSAVAALAFQPNAETWLTLGGILLEAAGYGNVGEVLQTAFPVDSDGHTCAMALTSESDFLIVSRIGTEAAFREVGGLLGDVWQLDEKGDLLVYNRTEGNEIQRAVRFAFHKTEGMSFFVSSEALLEQAVAAGVAGENRLLDSADFKRMMGACGPHNTMRYRADDIPSRSTRRLTDLLSGFLPGGVISRFMSLDVFNMGGCGIGVKSGDTYHRYGREFKAQHAVVLPVFRAVCKTFNEAMWRAGSHSMSFSQTSDGDSGEMSASFVVVCEGGELEWDDEADAWVIEPEKGLASVTVANLPEGVKVAVKCGKFVVPCTAFMGFGEGNAEGVFSLALNPDGIVRIGEKEIPVRPVIGNLGGEDAADQEPFVVGEESVAVTVETIPGLAYALRRGRSPRPADEGWGVVGEPETAKETRLKLTDHEPPPDQAFYVIEVSVP